jgi:hypothetical protein
VKLLKPYDELFSIAERLENLSKSEVLELSHDKLSSLEKIAGEYGRAFSGSWQGYHANVYYNGLRPPPPGAHFSQEWGLMDTFGSLGSHGDWVEYNSDELIGQMRKRAGNPDLSNVKEAAEEATDYFNEAKSDIESILLTADPSGDDNFLKRTREELGKLKALTAIQIVSQWAPRGQIMTRDTVTLGQGTRVPPHKVIEAEVTAIRHAFGICAAAAKIARKAASHLERQAKDVSRSERIGTNVFIGHGRSPMWRELKDFIQDRMKLPWDEFNRVPVAGITNQSRLAEMLDSAAIAFVVMTAEDETSEGTMHARMNVIHEVGLFQGRLGFTRAIVLLEQGCEEFSNIQGLGQIRFPAGRISACFEEVRLVLEREGLV